jgi:hypothetical protein
MSDMYDWATVEDMEESRLDWFLYGETFTIRGQDGRARRVDPTQVIRPPA